MSKKTVVLVMVCLLALASSAQTLFTYGKYSASVNDFLKAFNKNSLTPPPNKAKAMREYLDLYIASRLKIQEAYAKGYDTLPQMKEDIQTLRSQIIDNYLNDSKTTDRLVNEAFVRSQKDIHVAHIYISFKNAFGLIDTAAAAAKANEVYEKLKSGEDFFALAEKYSSDPSVNQNKGDIGYITVFTLPYQFENIVYNLAPGKFSSPYRSKIGFHFFKNLGERKAMGKMKAAQILLSFPPDNAVAMKEEMKRLADSLYNRIMQGDDFGKLAAQFSNDQVSAVSHGVIPDFTVGQYDAAFENAFMSLANNQVSKPFLTSHGYHILKRLGVTPVNADPKNTAAMDELKSKVMQSDRMQVAKRNLIDSLMKKISLVKNKINYSELWYLQDSLLDRRNSPIPITINEQTVLFTIGGKPATVEDYIAFARTWRYKPDGTGQKPYQQIYDEFMQSQVEEYYKEHLEDFNEDFRYQMNEFKEGNLFFEIMQQQVWSKAQTDTAALMSYYQKNKSKYHWKESADAIIFFCSDEATAKELYQQIKNDAVHWKKYVEANGEKIVADSSRYEYAQIPNANKSALKAGAVTAPVNNENDGTVSFAYIIKTYPANQPRSFAEAKGLVINDYQNELEKKWVSQLKKKYPVKINEAVFAKISK
ncbi:MAG: hypothetical protein C4308_09535 [Chitinophagaceae bacterium]